MIRIKAVMELFSKGTDKAKKEVSSINQQLDQAADNADRMNRSLSQTKLGRTAMHEAGIMTSRDYRGARGISGARAAEGRNFSGMASMARQDTGGFVAAYATVAANLFAITAAFQALSNAAKVEQLTKGLEILGSTSGVTLSNVSKGLQEVTGFAISSADAMRSVALASSAGLSKDEIEGLGKIAKGASIALGRDLSDSLDRLTKGAIKLEPELLDELGIMVRLDDAVNEYARTNDKAASALTLTERRQAFLNAILAEGTEKFGTLSDSANPSAYDKLSAGFRELGTNLLSVLNNGVNPLVNALAAAPALALIPLMGILQAVSSKVLPSFDTSMGKVGQTLDKYNTKLSLVQTRFEELDTSIGGFTTKLYRYGKAYAKSSNQFMAQELSPALRDPDIGIKNNSKLILGIDKEILLIRQKIATADGVASRNQLLQIKHLQSIKATLISTKKSHQEILRTIIQQNAAVAIANAQASQRGIIEEFNSNILSKGLFGATFTALGDVFRDIIQPGFKRATLSAQTFGGTLTMIGTRFKILGIAAVTTARVIGIAFLQAIPIIGQLVMVGSFILGAFKLLESEAKKKERALIENLKNINDNAKEVEKQINKAFEKRDYGTGFEAAITSLSEIIDALKEIRDLRLNAFGGTTSEDAILSRDFFSTAQRAFKNKNTTGFDPLSYYADFVTQFDLETRKATAKTAEEAKALNNAVARIEAIRGQEYAKNLKERLKGTSDQIALLEKEEKIVEGISSSWTSVKEESAELAKTLKQFYGKPITETTYSPVVGSLINISREVSAVQTAFGVGTDESVKALSGLYKSLSSGGVQVFAELDKLANDSTYSFLQTYYQIEDLERNIKTLQRAGVDSTDSRIIASQEEIERLESDLAARLSNKNLAIAAKINDSLEQSLNKRKNILDLSKRQLDIENNIANKRLDIFNSNRDIERLRALGTKTVSEPLRKLDSVQEAEKKLKIEQKGYDLRVAVINLEFELENLKLKNTLRSLESQVNLINSFTRLDGSKTGKDIASEIMKSLGSDKSFNAFSIALSTKKFFPTSDTSEFAPEIQFSQEEVNALYDYAIQLDYINNSTAILNSIREKSIELEDATLDASRRSIDVLREEIYAQSNLVNIRDRDLSLRQQQLDLADDLLDRSRNLEDIVTNTTNIRARTRAVSSGRTYNPIFEEVNSARTALNRLIQDEVNLRNRNALALEVADEAIFRAQDELKLALSEMGSAITPENLATLEQLEDALDKLIRNRVVIEQTNNTSVENLGATIDEATAALGLLTASIPSLTEILNSAKKSATGDLGVAVTGVGMNMLGAGDTFRSLMEQTANDLYGGDMQALLGDSETVSRIKEASKEIAYLNIQSEGLNAIFGNMNDSITNAFVSAIEGSEKLGKAFGNMAQQILRDLTAMIIKMLVFKTIEMGINFVTGGTGGTALMNLLGVSKGAAGGVMPMATGGVMNRASGVEGIIKQPTYLVGEGRYNEAVVPLPNGRAIPVQMHGNSGSTNNVQVNVNMTSSSTQTQTEGVDQAKLGQAVAAAVQRELVAQRAPGGLLNRYSAI